MKTIRRPKSRNKVWIYSWTVIGVLVVAVIIQFGGLFVSIPLIKVGTYVSDIGAATFGSLTSKNSIVSENQQLKDQLAEVQVAIDRDKLLVQENSDLKDLLGRHSNNSTVLATVLSKPPMSLYDTAIVDVGSSDKVAVGDTVLALGYVPIGVVSSVNVHSSVVEFYSSSGQKINVNLGKNIQTVAEARGNGNFLIKLPKGSLVAEGDPISAPSIGAEIFGHVENISSNENEPFIYLRFTLPVNISQLHFVQIDRNI